MSPARPSAAKKTAKPKLKYATWEHPKGSGIKIAEIPNKTGKADGRKVFGVSYQVRIPAELLGKRSAPLPRGELAATGEAVPPRKEQREFHQRKTKAEAERLAEDRFLALRKFGTDFTKIPATAQKQAAMAWDMLKEHGIDFITAAEAAIKFLKPEGGDRTVSATVAELLASKDARYEAGKLTKRTRDDFKTRGERFAEAFGKRPIKDITHTEIAHWLDSLTSTAHGSKGKPLNHRSILNYRNTLAELFAHAHAKRYCAENPMERFTREDYKALGGIKAERSLDDVNILTVTEARKLLNAALEKPDSAMLPSAVLRLFCGIRTAEVSQLDWKDVHWNEPRPYVHVSGVIAKKRRIRHVEIPANALAWLQVCNPPTSGQVAPGGGNARYYSKLFSEVVKRAGLGKEDENGRWVTDWEANDTRHSFGSYHYALHGDSIRTAKEMGHKQNDEVLFAHYRALVQKQDAEEYFGILPPADQSKVTAFTQATA